MQLCVTYWWHSEGWSQRNKATADKANAMWQVVQTWNQKRSV